MNCQDTTQWIHAYADGELDITKALEVEQHLATCESCQTAHRQILALRAAIRQPGVAPETPPALRRSVRAAIRREAWNEARSERTPFFFPLRIGFGVAFACAMLALGGLVLDRTPSATDRLADEVTSGHVRSLLANHLMDVASTDQHTVKPWFDGRVDFAPEVRDLAAEGFPLVGGRLDYLDGRPVAALVYKRQKHWINVFTWPAPGTKDSAPVEMTRRGYHLIHWTRGEVNWWAVSDLNLPELHDFAGQL